MRHLLGTVALSLSLALIPLGAFGCSSDTGLQPGRIEQSLDVFTRDQCPGYILVGDADGGVWAEYDDPWGYVLPPDDAGTTWKWGTCPDGGSNSLHTTELDYGTPTAAQCDRVKFMQPIPRTYSSTDPTPVPLADDVHTSDTVCFGFAGTINDWVKNHPYSCYALSMYYESATPSATEKPWDPADRENLDIWTPCKNKLFMKCAMAGLLHYRSGSVDERITKIRWVTTPKAFRPGNPMATVTGREMCTWAKITRGDLPVAHRDDAITTWLYDQHSLQVQF
jgi:hypothetical protein